MKKLEIIIKPEKLEDLKAVLEEANVNGLNIANIMGYGNQKGVVKRYLSLIHISEPTRRS